MYTNIQVPSAQEVFFSSTLALLYLYGIFSCVFLFVSFSTTTEQKHKQTRRNNNDGCEVFVLVLSEWKQE